MQIDLSLMPAVFDRVHVLLAGSILILLLLQVILLTLIVIGLLHRSSNAQSEKRAAPSLPEQPSPLKATTIPFEPRVIEKIVEKPVVKTETVVLKEATPDAAMQLLGLLQKEARFVDFVRENVAAYTDADIGVAARLVHEGCRKVLSQYFEMEPIRAESESSRITLPKGFDAGSVRVTGNIVGEPPFNGVLIHRGWRVSQVKLPKIAEGHDIHVVAQAEVEL